MAEYYMEEMNDLNGTGNHYLYPRMRILGQIGTEQLVEDMSRGTTFNKAEAKALLELFADRVSSLMAMGYSVKVDGFGSFAPGLGLKKGVEREVIGGNTRRNAQSVEVSKVYFRPDKNLIISTNMKCDLSRIKRMRRKTAAVGTVEERLSQLLDYLREHHLISIREYANLTGHSILMAGKELRQFRSQGHITTRGRRTHILYTLPAMPG